MPGWVLGTRCDPGMRGLGGKDGSRMGVCPVNQLPEVRTSGFRTINAFFTGFSPPSYSLLYPIPKEN